MRAILILLLLIVAGCAASGPDSDISIGPPITVQQAEKEMEPHSLYSFEKSRYEFGQEWEDFVSKIMPGDELRSYMHPRGGKGYAIVRSGVVEDVYFWVIF